MHDQKSLHFTAEQNLDSVELAKDQIDRSESAEYVIIDQNPVLHAGKSFINLRHFVILIYFKGKSWQEFHLIQGYHVRHFGLLFLM